MNYGSRNGCSFGSMVYDRPEVIGRLMMSRLTVDNGQLIAESAEILARIGGCYAVDNE